MATHEDQHLDRILETFARHRQEARRHQLIVWPAGRPVPLNGTGRLIPFAGTLPAVG